jgi:hypothetical protein
LLPHHCHTTPPIRESCKQEQQLGERGLNRGAEQQTALSDSRGKRGEKARGSERRQTMPVKRLDGPKSSSELAAPTGFTVLLGQDAAQDSLQVGPHQALHAQQHNVRSAGVGVQGKGKGTHCRRCQGCRALKSILHSKHLQSANLGCWNPRTPGADTQELAWLQGGPPAHLHCLPRHVMQQLQILQQRVELLLHALRRQLVQPGQVVLVERPAAAPREQKQGRLFCPRPARQAILSPDWASLLPRPGASALSFTLWASQQQQMCEWCGWEGQLVATSSALAPNLPASCFRSKQQIEGPGRAPCTAAQKPRGDRGPGGSKSRRSH